jgi:hypothetical protein
VEAKFLLLTFKEQERLRAFKKKKQNKKKNMGLRKMPDSKTQEVTGLDLKTLHNEGLHNFYSHHSLLGRSNQRNYMCGKWNNHAYKTVMVNPV